MRYIKEFNSFIGEEWSKNEPIPEILDRPKGLAIFLIGAPGIGKCMEYETPILINDKVEKIGSYIEKHINTSMDGELKIKAPDGSYVNSITEDGDIVKNEISYLYRGYSDKMISIKSQTGIELKVTPIHPLLVSDEKGEILWKMAKDLTKSDRIGRPRFSLHEDVESDVSTEMARLLGYMLSDGDFYRNESSMWMNLTSADKEIVDDFNMCVNKESDGFLQLKSSCRYRNSVCYVDKKMGNNLKGGGRNTIKRDFISKFSDLCGDYIFGKKSYDVKIPEKIMQNKNLLKNFLACYLCCDGSVYKNRVEYYTSSDEMARDICYSLSKFGILAIKKDKYVKLNNKEFKSNIIRITGKDYDLFGEIFNDYISLDRKKIFRISGKSNPNIGSILIPESITNILKEEKILKKVSNASKHRFYKRVSLEKMNDVFSHIREEVKAESIDRFQRINNSLFFDSILDIEEIDHNDYVYDVVLDEHHNFIGGNIPTILHNSTFVNRFIHPKNPNIKDFSTDDISLLYTKDPNVYYRGKEKPEGGRTSNASQLNMKKMMQFITTGNSFIYDTTGSGKEYTDTGFAHVKEIFDKARENGYEIVFIHMLSTLQTSIDQDKLRDRHVDPHYIQWAYAKQMGGEVDGQKVEGNMPRYKALGPDQYYVVLSIDRKYTFMKYVDGKLCKKKGDRYVPMNESVSDDSFSAYDLLQYLHDMADAGFSMKISDAKGNVAAARDIYDETEKAKSLQIEVRHARIVRTHFKLEIAIDTFESLDKAFTEMYLVNERLKEEGFALVDLDLQKGYSADPKEIRFNRITYIFEKPDQALESDQVTQIDKYSIPKSEVVEAFKRRWIDVNHVDYHDEKISVHYDHPVDDYTGNYRDIDRDLHSICVAIGATSYEVIDREQTEFWFD